MSKEPQCPICHEEIDELALDMSGSGLVRLFEGSLSLGAMEQDEPIYYCPECEVKVYDWPNIGDMGSEEIALLFLKGELYKFCILKDRHCPYLNDTGTCNDECEEKHEEADQN